MPSVLTANTVPLPELPPGAPLLLEPAPLELPPMEPLLLEVLPPELLLPPLELPELLVLLEPPLEELLPASWELLLPLEQAARPSVRARPQTSPSIGFSVIVRLHRSEAGNTAATWREAALRRGFSAWLNAGRILGARCGKLDDKKAMNLKLQATPYIGLAGSIQDLTFAPVSDQINQSFN